jgi:hypothetical protein
MPYIRHVSDHTGIKVSKEKRELGRPGLRWEEKIKMDVQ